MDSSSALEKYGKDLTKLAKDKKLDPVVGRENEIQSCIQILSRRTKNNPVLIGEHGVGKTAIAAGIAWRIAEGDDIFFDKRLISLDVGALDAEPKKFEQGMNAIIDEVTKSNGEIMLFVDDIHKIVTEDLLRRSISRGELRCIGATTMDEYHKHIEKDPTLARSFTPVYVDEPSIEETISILEGLRPKYEQHHRVRISKRALKKAALLSDQHIIGKFLPAKAIELIDDTASAKVVNMQAVSKHVGSDKSKLIPESETESSSDEVTDDNIVEVVSKKTKIPEWKLKQSEEEKLLHLEEELRKRVVGQGRAVEAVVKAVQRSRVGLGNQKRPTASFLFMGPMGVGKTKLAKALAYLLFNTEEALVRFDMSAYKEKQAVSRLIGSPPDEGGLLTEAVRCRPYSVILFDEIEKAHPELLDEVLLPILDEGKIKDAAGRLVNFTNTVIIMTSNAGSKLVLEDADNITNKLPYQELKEKVISELQQPELINRVDESVVFQPLDTDQIISIVKLKVNDLSRKMEQDKGMKIQVMEDALKLLGRWGRDLNYGAWPVKRVIQKKVEDELAKGILVEKFKQGDTIVIDAVPSSSSTSSRELSFTKPQKDKSSTSNVFPFTLVA
ncbi:chaperone protein ClpB3, chloroplastic [Arachis duranensis]|uniref:Chaperone protein ClpB3, chloroplastic n=1 Tax=Arachis duranensis TaxID=130453 RepID=A0A6P4D8W3_ARADU|nr:chaperone protein ClpB3, chloroplastic [Arachis duranensis]XP_015962712.1 chaperone protein ClpB3, chloroplastic [Arachis duranensis]